MGFVDLPAPLGHLEALHWSVERPLAAAVVCHPHPLHGGTMHNHVTYRVAQAWRDAQVACVRFNFRGVGRSTGAHDHGVGEVDDALAALDWLAAQHPGVPLYASGFSFGCRAALQLALREPRVQKVLAVGLAVDLFDVDFVQGVRQPVAFVHGDRDEFGALDRLEALRARMAAKTGLFVVPDCDHLASGRLDAFSGAAARAVAWLLQA
jgi:alpha/beta superfamily hydrolase